MGGPITKPLKLLQSSSNQPASYIPRFVYGTAWKKERTAGLVAKALGAGFTGIDTAAQPRHYQEDLVGEGMRRVLEEGSIKRQDLYVQTKYTSPTGQDPENIPYDPSASFEAQVRTSIGSSLQHLRASDEVSYIDTLIMHSPLPTMTFTLEAWRTLEAYVPAHIHNLGISNITLPDLKILHEAVTIKPAVVQNRFYPGTKYDVPLRRYCRENGIVYQSFWTLTGNPRLVGSSTIANVAKAIGVTKEIGLYLCVMGLGNVSVLNGTTNEGRMREDIKGLERWNHWYQEHEGNQQQWQDFMINFKTLIGE